MKVLPCSAARAVFATPVCWNRRLHARSISIYTNPTATSRNSRLRTRLAWRKIIPSWTATRRTAFLALGLFLAVNGWRLETTQIDAIETMLSLARGTLDESALASWIRGRLVREK